MRSWKVSHLFGIYGIRIDHIVSIVIEFIVLWFVSDVYWKYQGGAGILIL